jgi:uncharacterized protein (DUF433 family)
MKRSQVISRDPDVQGGAPVFAGTRVPARTLIDYLKDGRTLEDFLDGYPSVTRAQAEALLQMALTSASGEEPADEETTGQAGRGAG